ncbi:ParA family protein [Xanthomonas sacchari]
MKTIQIRFDDSLPALVDALLPLLGADALEQGTVLRDATGRLCFFCTQPAGLETSDTTLNQALANALGPYARPGRTVVFADEPGASAMLASPERIPVKVAGVFCHLVDRRIVGSGWLSTPTIRSASPARIVFSTLKGGVGRSTALAVTAADLARRAFNVLVVDLDLEAPGLGDLMLDEESIPDYGVIDFLVENGLSGVDDISLSSFLASSRLTEAGGGRVDVMPALGRKSQTNPENVLPKLSRAMIEDITDQGSITVEQQISTMIERATRASSYDVVLIDSRAGLSELAAPAVLGIGANVLLFGTAQKQTIEGYRSLFAALQLLAQRDRAQSRTAEWRLALRPVYAKASSNPDIERRFIDEMYELYSEHLYDAEDEPVNDGDLVRFVRDDNSAPHWPLTIPFNQSFIDFDPLRTPGQLTAPFYEQAFRPFLNAIDAIIAAPLNISPP